MATYPSVSAADIGEWTGERSLELGRRAYRTGALRRLRRRDATLLGLCQGSLAEPYRVEVRLIPDGVGIAAAGCTCGMGAEGRCKHVAALVTAWIEDPSAFAAAQDLDTTLDRLSKESLLLLVRRLMRRTDGLVAQVERELPFVTGEVASAERVHTEALRREALTALGTERRAHYDDWPERGDGEGDEVRARMQPLLDMGADYLARRQYALAAAVYRTVAQTAIESYDTRTDPAGQRCAALGMIVRACSAGLGDCLAGAQGAGSRLVTLRALVAVAMLCRDDGVNDGGLAREILIGRTTPEERDFAAEQVRAALLAGEIPDDGALHLRAAELLLALAGAAPDAEALLRLYRETGQTAPLVAHLLDAGRAVEAIAEVGAAADVAALLPALDALEARGQSAAAARIAGERLRADQDVRLARWLREAAVRRGDVGEALALAIQTFHLEPGVVAYRDARALAGQAGTWPVVRGSLRDWLAREGRNDVLAEVCLEDGDLDAALDTFSKADATSLEDGTEVPLAVRLAEAAEQARPDAAIRLYRGEALRQIARGGRQRLALAAGYLARVKALLGGLGRDEEWERLLGEVRARQGERRGLAYELRRAGL